MYSREVVYSLCTKLLTNQNGSRFVDLQFLQPHFHFSGKFEVLFILGESEEKGTMTKEPGSMMTEVNSGSSNGITLWAMELGEEHRGLVTCVPSAPTSTRSIQVSVNVNSFINPLQLLSFQFLSRGCRLSLQWFMGLKFPSIS